jgi:hypothetical protein
MKYGKKGVGSFLPGINARSVEAGPVKTPDTFPKK